MSRFSASTFRRLHEVLLFAFPNRGALERMVAHYLGENLNIISGAGGLSDVVFDLVQWADAQGRVAELVAAARAANQSNPDLAAFEADEFPAKSPVAASTGSGQGRSFARPEANISAPLMGPVERLRLVQRLSRLQAAEFDQLVVAINLPAEVLPGQHAPQGSRAAALIQCVQDRPGGVASVIELLDVMAGAEPGATAPHPATSGPDPLVKSTPSPDERLDQELGRARTLVKSGNPTAAAEVLLGASQFLEKSTRTEQHLAAMGPIADTIAVSSELDALRVYREGIIPAAGRAELPAIRSSAAVRAAALALATDTPNAARVILEAQGLVTPPDREALRPLEAVLFRRPWYLRRLVMRDVGCFPALEFRFPQAKESSAPVTFLIGPNGAGKSTVLRAICLALSTGAGTTELLRARSAGRFLRSGADQSAILLEGSWEVPPVRIVAEPPAGTGDSSSRLSPREEWLPPFVAAYGACRGSALGDAEREEQFSQFSAMGTLFDEHAPLLHVASWLQRRALDAATGGPRSPAARFLSAVLATLTGRSPETQQPSGTGLLPGVSELHVNGSGIRVSGDGIGVSIPLEDLSDGYLTTAGWVLDLIARWAERAVRAGVVLENDFAQTMTGVVLVDEVDQHLHPEWQRNLMVDLRRTFPRIAFVVTTHNPVTLLSARSGEVFTLSREADEIHLAQLDIPQGADVDGLLTGPLFDLPSTLDRATFQALQQHLNEYARTGTHTAGESELRARLAAGSPNTSLECLALDALEQALRERGSTPRGADERNQTHQRVRELIAARLKSAP